MELLEIKSIVSLDAPSLTSLGSGSVSQPPPYNFFSCPKDNVKVVIRVRPLNDKEKNQGNAKKCVTVENSSTITVEGKPENKVFNFDFVGHENLDQETVFNQIAKPIADSCLEGYNGSIFAYGQTGAGKTFTIQGAGLMLSGGDFYDQNLSESEDYEKRGLMSRSFEYLFECIQKAKKEAENQQGETQFISLVRCSYLEIYNEQIMDLLEPDSVNLHIREDIKKGVYVEGLSEEVVSCSDDLVSLILRGSKNRHVGSTSMNKDSSRSHSVLTTIIETKSMKEGGVWNIKSSRFHIIDLAGSERQKFTNAMGERLKEAGMINKSLSALGNVINSLVDISEGKNRHVHYRDSKLTFLLRDSLGGNSKTVIIANISPSQSCMGETISTLKFAQRAKLIKNKAVINEDSSGTIQLLKSEINRLKKELAESEQRYQSSNLQCAFCRNNINGEQNFEDDLNDDEMLLDQSLLNQSINFSSVNGLEKGDESLVGQTQVVGEQLQKKFKQQKLEIQTMKKRIVYIEGLLSANLDNLTSQQKFYDSELQKSQQQNKRLQQAVDSYEKQCARDKMIIKFREERIAKLESHQPLTPEEKTKQMNDLKKEIQLWKDAFDHNPQNAKLFAEKAELQKELDQLKKETKQTPDSLNAQMRSLVELNEGLNEYLKLYCEESKKEVEQELARVKLDLAERVEEFNTKLEELNKHEQEWEVQSKRAEVQMDKVISEHKVEIQKLKEQSVAEKEQIEKQNREAFEQFKREIEEISENKTESEKEAQSLKVKLMEKEREHENSVQKKEQLVQEFQGKEEQFIKQIKTLQEQQQKLEEVIAQDKKQARSTIDELTGQIEIEKRQASSRLKAENENWQKKLQEIEKQFMVEQNERGIAQEQCDQLSSRIKSLENENETIQETLIFKEEEISELKRLIKERENEIEKLKQANDSQTELLQEKQAELESLKSELSQSVKDGEELRASILEINNEMKALKEQKCDLEKEIMNRKKELEDIFGENDKLKDELELSKQKINQLIQEFNARIEGIQSSQESQNCEYEMQIQELEKAKGNLQEQLSLKSVGLEDFQHQLTDQNQKHQIEFDKQAKLAKEEIQNLKEQYEERIHELSQSLTEQTQRFDQENKTLLDIHNQQILKIELELKEEQELRLTEQQARLQELSKQKEEEVTEKLRSFEIEKQQDIQKYKDQIKDLQNQIKGRDELLTEINQSMFQKESTLKLQFEKKEEEFKEKVKIIEESHSKQVIEGESEYNSMKQKLEKEISELKEQQRNLENQVQSEQKKLKESAKSIQEQKKQFDDKAVSYQSTIDKLREQSSSQNTQSTLQIQKLSEDLQDRNLQIEKLTQQWKEQLQTIQNQNNQLKSVNEELKVQKQKFIELQLERNQLKQQESSYSVKYQELLQESSKLKKEIDSQKKLLEESLTTMKNDHSKKCQELQQEAQASKNTLQVELESYKLHCKDLNQQLAKQRQKNDEQNEIINESRERMNGMVSKENHLMLQLEKNISELKDHQDKWQNRIQDIREEKDQIKKEQDRLKKENENLRELVKLKDKQIEEQLDQDEKERDQQEKLYKDNEKLKKELTRREFEMENIVRTLKFYSEEKTRLEAELNKLHRENDQLIGHKNPSQKIQHHLKIKEENNRLKEENFKLQEELRRKTDILIKKGIQMSKDQSPVKPLQQTNENAQVEVTNKDDMKKLKNANQAYQETINRLVDHILSQPGLNKNIGISEDIFDKIQQSTGQTKVKNAMEIISLFNNVIQNKEREMKEMVREKKKMEYRLDIVEKEKNLCKQQLELIQNTSPTNTSGYLGQQNNNNYSGYANSQEQKEQQWKNHQNSQQHLERMRSQERVISEFSTVGGNLHHKQSQSPFYGGYKHQLSQKESHSLSKKEFGEGEQRSVSGIRRGQQYLQSNTQNQK